MPADLASSYDPPRPDTNATLILWAASTESWRGLILDVDAEGQIVRLSMNPARPPSDLPKSDPLTPEQVAEKLGGFVDRAAARDTFSGTVLLAKDGKVLLTKAVGLANRDFDVPVTLDTKFNLGSMNKMMTAVACMQLVEAGKLSLDDPIGKHLGEDWLPKVDKSKVKVRHLLTHTSGLGSYFTEEFDRSSRALYRTVDDWKPLVRDETLAFEPGTRWQYSNTGMHIAGAIIEKVAGTEYYDYVRRHITGPAGMTGTDRRRRHGGGGEGAGVDRFGALRRAGPSSRRAGLAQAARGFSATGTQACACRASCWNAPRA